MLAWGMTIEVQTEECFMEALLREHGQRMYHIAHKILTEKCDAEDAVQETLIKIFRHIDMFRNVPREELPLLLVIYTKNTARDLYRRRKRDRTIPLLYETDGEDKAYDIPDPGETPDEIVIRRERAEILGRYMDDLPEEQRHAVLLKYRFHMRDKEIACAMGISETAVSSRLYRAKQSLRKRMEGVYETE